MEYLESDFFLIALTFAVFFAAKRLQARTGWVVLNPILLSILFLMGFLKLTGVPYSSYAESASIIEFWLKPAIVALGVPLYLQLGWVKLRWVKGISDFLVGNMGFFFVPPGVALMLYFDVIAAEFWPIVTATVVSTVLVLIVTGHVHQWVRKHGIFRK